MKGVIIGCFIVLMSGCVQLESGNRHHDCGNDEVSVCENESVGSNHLRCSNKMLYSLYRDAFVENAANDAPGEHLLFIPNMFNHDSETEIDSIRYNFAADTIFCINNFYEHVPALTIVFSNADYLFMRDTVAGSCRISRRYRLSRPEKQRDELYNSMAKWNRDSVIAGILKFNEPLLPYAYCSRLIINDGKLVRIDTLSVNSDLHTVARRCHETGNYGDADFVRNLNPHLSRITDEYFKKYKLADGSYEEGRGPDNCYQPIIYNKRFLKGHVRPPYYERVDSFRYNYARDTIYCVNMMSIENFGEWSMRIYSGADGMYCGTVDKPDCMMLEVRHLMPEEMTATRNDEMLAQLKRWNLDEIFKVIRNSYDHPACYVTRMVIVNGRIVSEEYFSSSEAYHRIGHCDTLKSEKAAREKRSR